MSRSEGARESALHVVSSSHPSPDAVDCGFGVRRNPRGEVWVKTADGWVFDTSPARTAEQRYLRRHWPS